ncbi:TPA: hypothetical protein UL920_004097 [Stenotrophomonas maltophilia]|uniref:MAE_28990/MAE_18760 family HEPN-like nuclease n=1 Tax=Stenotrophomonas maltophilia TaxID=40324 RepID=UPI002A9A0D41|nr:MAE_28990/MAE_18760 family HEPN-like nuclease [Stenotrophomonas maltophilia]HEL4860544.1 hypothetical protein [Stenotrophomonas maltophilia]HEL7636092.1 hypothetical protein [Stenotrophomonas maltophilia]
MAHEVVEEIVASNEWRLNEFAKIRMNSANVEDSLWWRLSIPMIYAHWEGYVVSSLRILIEHLNELQLQPERVPTKLIVLGLGDCYRSLSGKQSLVQRITFTDRFKGLLRTTITFEKKINTKSNLRSEVLQELCDIYGFDFQQFRGVTGDINRLVNIRNCIAHGENSILPSADNVKKYIDSVIAAADILRNEIEGFLAREEYFAPTETAQSAPA